MQSRKSVMNTNAETRNLYSFNSAKRRKDRAYDKNEGCRDHRKIGLRWRQDRQASLYRTDTAKTTKAQKRASK